MSANIGDIVVLSNGLNLKLVLESRDNHFKTIDVASGKNVTTGININKLDQFSVGLSTWGYGSEEHEIVEIIKEDEEDGIETMNYTYYVGKRVKIINFNGWRKDFKGDYSRTDKYIGAIGKIEKVREYNSHKFMIKYDDQELQEIDKENSRLYFRPENIEFIDEDTYEHIKKPKPPLGVMPKNIFELQRVQELCRALYDRSIFEEVDYNLMIKWSDELNDRLYGLKGDKEFDLLGNL